VVPEPVLLLLLLVPHGLPVLGTVVGKEEPQGLLVVGVGTDPQGLDVVGIDHGVDEEGREEEEGMELGRVEVGLPVLDGVEVGLPVLDGVGVGAGPRSREV